MTTSDERAKQILDQVLEDVPELKIDRWIEKLKARGHEPLVYALALEMKAKRLDGADGFFIAMDKQDAEDDWLATMLRKARDKVTKDGGGTTQGDWPYPRGSKWCRKCRGLGWYAEPEHLLDEEHGQWLDEHVAAGYELIHYGSTERIVFICIDCNPNGQMLESAQGKLLPRYPIGGTPFTIDFEEV